MNKYVHEMHDASVAVQEICNRLEAKMDKVLVEIENIKSLVQAPTPVIKTGLFSKGSIAPQGPVIPVDSKETPLSEVVPASNPVDVQVSNELRK